MKAIILIGGRGTRLSPLTDKKPKPLITVGDIPIIETLIKNLARQGISECAVTLGYRGDDIKKALGSLCHGVKITYFEEKEPLGTAGAVKNCKDFLDGDFIVTSGDALCDLDLKSALACHEMSGNTATIVLTPSSDVLEYGVVLLDKLGKVTGFSEKPAWEGVKSDLVNCGIYLFKKEVLDLIPENTFWDFGSQVFPEMLSRNIPINTYISHSFWCDVGNPWALYSCNMKTLSPDFFLHYSPEGVRVSRSAHVSHSVIGKGTVLKAGCDVRRAVIGQGCEIGEGAELIGCILGDRVKIGRGVRVERGAVIGDDSYVSDSRLIGEGKRLPADTRLDGDEASRSFTSSCTLWHNGNIVFDKRTPEDFFALGRGAISLGEEIGFMYSPDMGSYLAATEAALGLSWSGGSSVIFGEGRRRDAVFGAGELSIPILYFEETEHKITVSPFQKTSLPLSRKKERELSASFERPPSASANGEIRYFDGLDMLEKQYITNLFDNPRGCQGRVKIKNNSDGKRLVSLSPEETLSASERGGEFFIEISSERGEISLSWDKKKLDTEHIHALILKMLIGRGRKVFSLPSGSPVALDKIAREAGCEIIRWSKTEQTHKASSLAMNDLWARDVFFAAVLLYKVLEAHGFSREKLSATVDSLPVFLCIKREVDTGEVSVGRIMRFLEREKNSHVLPEGIELFSDGGGVRVTPDNKNKIKLFAEAHNTETANELCDAALNIISNISE